MPNEVCVTLLVFHFSLMTVFNDIYDILVLPLYSWSVLAMSSRNGKCCFVSIPDLRMSRGGSAPCPWSQK